MLINRNKKLIIFDFDGVIAISNHIKTEAFAEIYREYGEDIVDKVVSHHLLNQGKSRYEKIEFYHTNFLKTTINEKEKNKLANKFSELVKGKIISSELMPGITEFLSICKESKIFCAINTATPEVEIKEIIMKKDMNKFFHIIYGSPLNKLQNIKKILKTIKIHEKKTVFIGDAISDYEAAYEANIDFIGIGKLFENKTYANMLFSSQNFNGIKINDT